MDERLSRSDTLSLPPHDDDYAVVIETAGTRWGSSDRQYQILPSFSPARMPQVLITPSCERIFELITTLSNLFKPINRPICTQGYNTCMKVSTVRIWLRNHSLKQKCQRHKYMYGFFFHGWCMNMTSVES